MAPKITIVDYGIGNLFSVVRAFEKCGATVTHAETPEQILVAERLVLPGVGAFYHGMEGLRRKNLLEALKEYPRKERPMLGICLGMQMLFDQSLEFGEHEGLGLIAGVISPIQPRGSLNELLKVPHIGWSPLMAVDHGGNWNNSILSKLPPSTHAYFVHSYTAIPSTEQDRLADTHYGDTRISAAVSKNNIHGCQFHPEKSAAAGLKIIERFLEL